MISRFAPSSGFENITLSFEPLTSGEIWKPCTKRMANKKQQSKHHRLSAQTTAKGERDIHQLGKMLNEQTKETWAIGDLLVRCIDLHEYRLCDVSEKLSQSKPYLSQLYSVAKAFPEGQRDLTTTWNMHEVCRASIDRATKEIERHTGVPQGVDYPAALARLLAARDEDGKPIRAHKREATRFFIKEARPRPQRN